MLEIHDCNKWLSRYTVQQCTYRLSKQKAAADPDNSCKSPFKHMLNASSGVKTGKADGATASDIQSRGIQGGKLQK